MIATTVTNTPMTMSEQEATGRPQRPPLLLSLLGSAAVERQPFSFVSEIASHITRRVEQHVRVSVVPTVYCDDQMSDSSTLPERLGVTLTAWLHQGVRRLLLVPWGGGEVGQVGQCSMPGSKQLPAPCIGRWERKCAGRRCPLLVSTWMACQSGERSKGLPACKSNSIPWWSNSLVGVVNTPVSPLGMQRSCCFTLLSG